MANTSDYKLLGSEGGDFYGTFNDIVISEHDIALVGGHSKIQQDIVKFLLTTKGSVPLFGNYGTIISDLVNRRNRTLVLQDLENVITKGLAYIKQKNSEDSINIDRIISISVNRLTRGLDIDLAVLLTDGQTLQIKLERW